MKYPQLQIYSGKQISKHSDPTSCFTQAVRNAHTYSTVVSATLLCDYCYLWSTSKHAVRRHDNIWFVDMVCGYATTQVKMERGKRENGNKYFVSLENKFSDTHFNLTIFVVNRLGSYTSSSTA